MWLLIIVGKEFESVHDAFTSRGRDVYILASIMMHCGTQRVSMLPMRSPSASLSWFFVCNDFASQRSKICFVVIHEAVEVSRDGELRMQPRGLQEIQLISDCGKSLSHKCNGNAGSTEESPATKCSLKVLMARSTALRRWQ
jgi:hypothetical protein